jgi:DNA-binding response OmpR family regulator
VDYYGKAVWSVIKNEVSDLPVSSLTYITKGQALSSLASSQKRFSVFLCGTNHSTSHPLNGYLTSKGFSVHCISESRLAVDQIITSLPDVVLLDTQLPIAGGYEVCSMVRPFYNGLILIKGEDWDDAAQLLAFERGADDYIVLPISPVLIAAKISAHLKRVHGLVGRFNHCQIRVGKLIVDAARREVFLSGQPVTLTTMQFDLLWYLAKRSGRVVPRGELYESLYQEKYNGFDRSVDICISRIRQQLGDSPEKPTYLKTIRGVGYLFIGQDLAVC